MAAVVEREAANLDCIHCGICLSVCPTYLQLGSEVDSPRGRIYLMKAAGEGRLQSGSPTFAHHMELCLECRACETACPSGVRFSVMMSDARAAIREQAPPSGARRFLFARVLPSRSLLRAAFGLLRSYQRSGLQKLVRSSGVLRLFPGRLQKMEALLPEVPSRPSYRLPAMAPRSGRASAALFEGCIMPELFGPVHEATVRVLERNQVSLSLPPKQTCCGALHLHDGERELARALARRNIDAFDPASTDVIVVNAAGCGAMLKEYGHLLEDDPAYAERAREFSRRVRDVSELLDSLGLDPRLGRVERKVAYDDPCHLLHGQGIKQAPRNLLRAVPGLVLVELRDADRCCGSAGIYNLTQPEMSARILDEKMSNVARSGAEIVATGNPGCLLQIAQGIRERRLAMEVLHPIEILDSAYRAYREPSR
jgi:glycolate oxidase iron-sulfur subunit